MLIYRKWGEIMFRDYKGYPIRMTIFTVIFAIIVIFLVMGLKSLVKSNKTDYEHVFNTRLPQQVLIQGESGQFYLASTKKKSAKPLELEADIMAFNPNFNNLFLFHFEDNQTKISVIKKYKDILIHEEDIEVPVITSKDDELEVKSHANQLFILNKTEKIITQVNLEKKQTKQSKDEQEDWPKVSQVPIEFEVQEWEVSDDSVYFMTLNQVMNYEFEKAEFNVILEDETLSGISLYQNFFTVLSENEAMAFLTSYDRIDRHLIDTVAFESRGVNLLKSSSAEPYVYFSHLNSQGGFSIHMTDVKSFKRYTFDLNINQVNHQLHFFRGYAYYINQENKAVIHTPKGKSIEFQLEEKARSINPFY